VVDQPLRDQELLVMVILAIQVQLINHHQQMDGVVMVELEFLDPLVIVVVGVAELAETEEMHLAQLEELGA
jgi:hypothetical protein